MTYDWFEVICFLEYPTWEIKRTWDTRKWDSVLWRHVEWENGKVLTFTNWGALYFGADPKDVGNYITDVPSCWMSEILKDKRFRNNMGRWKIFKDLMREIKEEEKR